MDKRLKIGLLLGVPILIGGYLIWKQFSKPSAGSKQDVPPPSPKDSKKTTKNPAAASDFPLVKGMPKNDNVKSLQALLNSAGASPVLVIDGLFGSKTLAALQSIYGKNQIDSSDDLDNLKGIVANKSAKSSNLDWAWKLIDAYNSGDYSNLVVSKNTELSEIAQNFQGIWKPTGHKLTVAAHSYNLDDYALRSAMTDGTLRIEITNGDLAGMYSTDPNIQLSDYLDIQ
jgi:hypothetical protein